MNLSLSLHYKKISRKKNVNKQILTLAPLAKLRQYKVNFVIMPFECNGGFQLTRIVSEDITTALISAGGPGTER